MSSNCLCMCFSTMRLLFTVSYVISQCFTIIARYIGCNLICFATGIHLVLATLFLSTIDYDPTYLIVQHLLLHSTMSTEERRKQAAYTPPPPDSHEHSFYVKYYRTMENVIGRAPRVQSYWRTFNINLASSGREDSRL